MNTQPAAGAVHGFLKLLFFAALAVILKGEGRPIPNIIIEDFETGQVSLTSWSGEDKDPDAWELNSVQTWNNSQWSLKIFGNTWKAQEINPVSIDSNSVWQVAAYVETTAEIQGFGLSDGENVIYYAFAGTQELNPETWIPVYQGCFPTNQWNQYDLPVGSDWLSFFGYLPEISELVYINDKDDTSTGAVYIDQVMDISEDQPIPPVVSVSCSGQGNTGIQFQCAVTDPDSDVHTYLWDFGDGTTSDEQNPVHTYQNGDAHPYTVLLRVTDDSYRYGLASCKVNVGSGNSSLPVKLNFVGDIMLARKYEYPGGIIPTMGVEAIFAPTLPWLGNAADITMANLECPFTTEWQHHPTKPIYFKGSPDNLQGLAFAGIDMVSLANNHVMDYLETGMLETFTSLETFNIKYSGAGSDSYEAYSPEFHSVSGLCFALLAASDRTGQYNNYQPYLNAGCNKPGFANLNKHYISLQIDEVRSVADYVIMEWHAGGEYSFQPDKAAFQDRFSGTGTEAEGYSPLHVKPSDEAREIRQFALDYGADMVVCHHPHIMQGVEIHNGKLIAHSLGDFVFDLDYPETFPTFILNAEAGMNGLENFSITPIYIDDYIPKRATGELGLYILNNLAQSSAKLNTWLKIDNEEVIATVIPDTLEVTQSVSTFDHTANMLITPEGFVSEPVCIEKEGYFSVLNYIKPSGDHEFRAGRELIWFGNMEDEGCSLWNLNSADETYCDTASFSGTRSICHQRPASSPLNIITDLENRIICRYDSAEYTLCGSIKTQNAGNVTIEIRYYSDRSGMEMLGEENIGTIVSGDNPWTFFFKQLTIPVGTRFFDIRLNSGVPTSGQGISWFDDVRLICWEPWGKYEINEPVETPNDIFYLQVRSNSNDQQIAINYSEINFEEIVVEITDPHPVNQVWGGLQQNCPNPFNPHLVATVFGYDLKYQSNILITVRDIDGRLVRILKEGWHPSGQYKIIWNGKDGYGHMAQPGVYFVSLHCGHGVSTKKCILLDY